MNSIIKKFFSIFLIMLLFSFSANAAATRSQTTSGDNDATTDVICNIIGYVWKIGGPLMTVVIIGASMLAIFGRMPWPALFALGVFCAVFFGAKAIVKKIAPYEDARNLLDRCGEGSEVGKSGSK